MRIILAGTGSAVGKTTIATGIMKALSEKYNVQPFKVGPDYIDPSYHTLATGNTSRNLDSFFMKEGQIRDSYLKAMKDKDIERLKEQLPYIKVEKLGVKRAILSRELSLEEIKEIIKKLKSSNSTIETEVFIHGAMCMAISGRCFLSYGLYGRSANCGDCLQPCRKEWKLSFEEDENDDVINFSECDDESFIISNSYDDSYRTNFFSPKDMALIEHIPELIEAGIDSFKIEGRARSPDYVATAVKVYREAIDLYQKDPENYQYNPKWMEELMKVFNRGYDTGFYFNIPHEISENNQSKFIKKDIAKVVNYYNKIKVAELKIWDDLAIGDEIMIQGPTTGSITHVIDSMQIDGKAIEKAKKGSNVAIAIDEKLRESDFVYKLIPREN